MLKTVKTRRRCGAIAQRGEECAFRVWAPRAGEVELVLIGEGRGPCRMQRDEEGYFNHLEARVAEGQRYVYRLDGGEDRPDPCSLWQPEGVGGPSAVVRPGRFAWTDTAWKGIRREELVFYELHVGTFTAEGTFEGVIPRLGALRELGITAVEIMPVGQFSGGRNWGYDGVLPYAAQNTYGGPVGLHRLVDACHSAGLAAFLDVVYNHLGPEGNYLSEFGPYFTDRYKTPWGQAVNYDDCGCDGVRNFILDNACMWLEEFHFDGLRLDAIHAIYDMGAHHILRAIQEVAEEVQERSGRMIHIIAESDLNDPRILWPPERGGYGLSAQWSDDFHHAVHAFLTGERRGYYDGYGKMRQLADVLNTPFLYAGNYCRHRGRKHGAPPVGLGGDRFVVCIQNHDQVGNRARGDRLGTILGSPAKQRLAASLLLLAPHLPLLFMGEEYGEENPFPFFCSFCGPELVQAVREGRKKEFADFHAGAGEIPDPDAVETFNSARLSWSWPEGTAHAGLRRMYADLLKARREWPALRDFEHRRARLLPDVQRGPILELVRGNADSAQAVVVYWNLSDAPQSLPAEGRASWVILFSSEWARYCGNRRDSSRMDEMMPFECVIFGPAECRPL